MSTAFTSSSSKRSNSRSRSRSTKSNRFIIPNNTSTLENDVFSFDQLVYCLPKLNKLPCLHKESCTPLNGDFTYGSYLQKTSKYRDCQCMGTSRNIQPGEYFLQLSTILTEDQLAKDLRSTKKISKDLRGLLSASIPSDAHREYNSEDGTTGKKPFVMSDGIPISIDKKKIYFNNYANFANFLDYYKIKRHSFCIFEKCPHFYLGFGDNRTAKRHIWNHLKDMVTNRNTYAFFEEDVQDDEEEEDTLKLKKIIAGSFFNDENFDENCMVDDDDDYDYDDLLTVDQKILKTIRKRESGTIDNCILASFFYKYRWRCDICHNIFIMDDKSSHSSSCANNATTTTTTSSSTIKKQGSAYLFSNSKNPSKSLKSKSAGILNDSSLVAATTPIKPRRGSNVSSSILMKNSRSRSNSVVGKKNRRGSTASISSVINCSTLKPANILEKDLEKDPRFFISSSKTTPNNTHNFVYDDYNLMSPTISGIPFENMNSEQQQQYSISLGVNFDSFTSFKNTTPSRSNQRSNILSSSFLNDTPSKIFSSGSSSLLSYNRMTKYRRNSIIGREGLDDDDDEDDEDEEMQFDECGGDGPSRSSSMSSIESIPISIFDDSFAMPFFSSNKLSSLQTNGSPEAADHKGDVKSIIEEIKFIERDTSTITVNSSNSSSTAITSKVLNTADELDYEYDEEDRYDYIMTGKGHNIFHDDDFQQEDNDGTITTPSSVDSNSSHAKEGNMGSTNHNKFTEEEMKLLVELISSDNYNSNPQGTDNFLEALVNGDQHAGDGIKMSHFNVFIKSINKEIRKEVEEEDIEVKEDRDIFVGGGIHNNNNHGNEETGKFAKDSDSESGNDSESSNDMNIFAESNPFFVENEHVV